ncbi:sensor histidine kinase [Dinghuibacter silviterrae]|uniref:histidine kinase n=1 Tax=Dinghuibacter silviterrae TaxID=1539049 RepID=A0A4R8DV13_9BACT|nr:hybrid sensor histidine kinase/response regulator [Dinghuibacter silviterrae]TDX02250.1 response regulator receiver domain-containing protein [Dinghuibacter silviterrae]
MSDNRIKILYLDDEINNLNTFRASFRRNYEIYTALTVTEAKTLLEEVSVEVIIADQRMPTTTGVEFFNSIKEKHPDPIRILLTGYTDVEDIIDSINKGQIYRFIRKPWEEFEIATAITNAHDLYTARKHLKEKVVALEKTNEELNRFIYSASHDMRSPLVSVLGIINLAKSDQSIIDPNGYVDLIESCILRLDEFIKKVIEYYRNTRVDADMEIVNFSQIIKEAIDTHRHRNNNVHFTVDVQEDHVFRGDAFRTAIILNNLISNAIKYQKSDEPNPKVHLQVRTYPHKAVITIEDNGVGILHTHLNDIFRMFFRSNRTDNAGTGIGLYIVKEALNKMGGTIEVDSTYGQGTKFEIILPNHVE